jgi:hypothetical protein
MGSGSSSFEVFRPSGRRPPYCGDAGVFGSFRACGGVARATMVEAARRERARGPCGPGQRRGQAWEAGVKFDRGPARFWGRAPGPGAPCARAHGAPTESKSKARSKSSRQGGAGRGAPAASNAYQATILSRSGQKRGRLYGGAGRDACQDGRCKLTRPAHGGGVLSQRPRRRPHSTMSPDAGAFPPVPEAIASAAACLI